MLCFVEGTMLDKFERNVAYEGRKLLHCAECERLTIHNAEGRCTGTWRAGPHDGGSHYTIYRCGACDTVCYETVSWDDQDIGWNEDGEPILQETSIQYPAPVSAHFVFNTASTPGQLDEILGEMLYALAGSKLILATVGLRLAIEFIANDKKCSGRTLQKRIDDLAAQGHVDWDQKELLHRIREKGNAGAHEAKHMSIEELVAGMSIVEGLLEKLYNGPARHNETIKRAKELLKRNENKPEQRVAESTASGNHQL